MAALTAIRVEWGIAGRPLDGYEPSGDLHVAVPYDGGILMGVIDGLGHGVEAAVASREAAHVCEIHAGRANLLDLMTLCHGALKHTRGAVLSLAAIDLAAGSLEWVGIGNVEGILLRGPPARGKESLLLRGGVVGYKYTPPRASVVPVHIGDILILATDGIAGAFVSTDPGALSAQELADHILACHGKSTDDALVLVVRILEPQETLP